MDIENLVGDPFNLAGVPDAMTRCLEAGCYRTGDHVEVAGNGEMLVETFKVVSPGFRMLPAHGPDGADLRLLEDADPDFLADRYDRVVIASGDHAFTGLLVELDELGVPAWVVGRYGSIHADLYGAAAWVVAF